jgi:hypothetical protein
MMAGNHSKLESNLELGLIGDWKYSRGSDLDKFQPGVMLPARQIVHYDTSSLRNWGKKAQKIPFPSSPQDFAARPAHLFFAGFDDIAVLSLWAPGNLLWGRIKNRKYSRPFWIRMRNTLLGRGGRSRASRDHLARRDVYHDESRFADMFSAWLAYAESLSPRIHLVIDTSRANFSPISVASFRETRHSKT